MCFPSIVYRPICELCQQLESGKVTFNSILYSQNAVCTCICQPIFFRDAHTQVAGAPNELIFLFKLKTPVFIFLASSILKPLKSCFRLFMFLFLVLKMINFA